MRIGGQNSKKQRTAVLIYLLIKIDYCSLISSIDINSTKEKEKKTEEDVEMKDIYINKKRNRSRSISPLQLEPRRKIRKLKKIQRKPNNNINTLI